MKDAVSWCFSVIAWKNVVNITDAKLKLTNDVHYETKINIFISKSSCLGYFLKPEFSFYLLIRFYKKTTVSKVVWKNPITSDLRKSYYIF